MIFTLFSKCLVMVMLLSIVTDVQCTKRSKIQETPIKKRTTLDRKKFLDRYQTQKATMFPQQHVQPCTICYDDITNDQCVASNYFACDHGKTIHQTCIDKIMLENANPSCPICRTAPKAKIGAKFFKARARQCAVLDKLNDAIEQEDIDHIQHILASKTNLNTSDANDLPLLHRAVLTDNIKIVKMLLRAGATETINTFDSDGDTPLHIATHNRSLKMVLLFLQHGAATSINVANHDEKTPLYLAITKNEHDIAQALLSFISKEALNTSDFEGNTPLHYVINEGISRNRTPKKMTDIFLSAGAGTSINTPNNDGFSPMMMAEACDFKSIVKIFQRHGGYLEL